jgi:DNA-3-methyladenine glycosylase II
MQKEINYLKKVDPKLGEVLHGKLEKIVPELSVYESLLSSIISQQVSTAAARSIKNKFKGVFGDKWPTCEQLIKVKPEKLRAAGLSGQKCGYVKNVATFFKEKDLHQYDFDSMSDEEIIEMLTEIVGVGRWTVEMILIFTLGRADVFAIKDGGLINGVMRLYKLEKYHPKSGDAKALKQKDFEKKILKITDKWSPYRSTASRYIWAYKDGE